METNSCCRLFTPCFPNQMENQESASETLSICQVIANVFLEIANFFRRLVCCGCEPFPLYTARVIDHTPSSDEEGFRNEFSTNESHLGVRKTESLELEDSVSEEVSDKQNLNEKPKERIPFISNEVIADLKSWKLSFNELDLYIERIETVQDAIELIDACKQLPPSIYEDVLRKLALLNYDDSVLSALHAKKINYKDYLPKDYFSDLVSVFNTAIYNELSLSQLSQLCRVDNKVNHSINGSDGYLDSKKFDRRITRLIELGDMFKEFEKKLNSKNESKPSWRTKEKLEDSKIYKEFYSLLNTLMLDLQTEKGLDTTKVKNNLFEYLLSEKRPAIKASCIELQKNVLTFFFEYGSDDQLSRFIQIECLYEAKVISPSRVDVLIGDFYECFFKELTDERQKKLPSLLEIENTTIEYTLVYSTAKFFENKEQLAKKLICSFYETIPKSEVWKEIEKEKDGIWRYIHSALAEKKISHLMDHFIASSNLKTEEDISKLADDIHNCIKAFPDSGNTYDRRLVAPYIKEILHGIFHRFDQIGKATGEQLLTAFVRAISLHPTHGHLFIELYIGGMSNSEEFSESWLSKYEAFSLKVYFQSLLDMPIKSWEAPWDSNLLRYISSEGQMIAFLDFCMELSDPLRTVQLSILKSEKRHRTQEQQEVLIRILEERKIVLPEDPDIDWTDFHVYCNAFRMKKFFDHISALDSQANAEIWIANHKTCEALLQILAGGVVLFDGSTIKCPMNADMIKAAFQANKLYYEGYAEPINIYDLLKSENLKI